MVWKHTVDLFIGTIDLFICLFIYSIRRSSLCAISTKYSTHKSKHRKIQKCTKIEKTALKVVIADSYHLTGDTNDHYVARYR